MAERLLALRLVSETDVVIWPRLWPEILTTMHDVSARRAFTDLTRSAGTRGRLRLARSPQQSPRPTEWPRPWRSVDLSIRGGEGTRPAWLRVPAGHREQRSGFGRRPISGVDDSPMFGRPPVRHLGATMSSCYRISVCLVADNRATSMTNSFGLCARRSPIHNLKGICSLRRALKGCAAKCGHDDAQTIAINHQLLADPTAV